MAICDLCEQEMTTATSCTIEVLHRRGVAHPWARWGDELRLGWRVRKSERCGDCAVERGGFHHLGCDMAECPLCREQLLSCGHMFDEYGPDAAQEEDPMWDETG